MSLFPVGALGGFRHKWYSSVRQIKLLHCSAFASLFFSLFSIVNKSCIYSIFPKWLPQQIRMFDLAQILYWMSVLMQSFYLSGIWIYTKGTLVWDPEAWFVSYLSETGNICRERNLYTMEPLFTLQHHRNMFWLSVCPRDRVFTKKILTLTCILLCKIIQFC